MNDTLQKLVDLIPVIKEFYRGDVYITVTDDHGTVVAYSVPAGVSPQLREGDHIEDPTGTYDDVLRTGSRKFNTLPKEVMGEPFEGVLVPVKDDSGETAGVIIISYPAGSKEKIIDMMNQFRKSVADITDSVSDISNAIGDMGGMMKSVNDSTSVVEEDVNSAVSVVNKISSNASRSNILALNASIEAARSGEYGRGFAVVATEMGKLAKDSGSSASAIRENLDEIAKHLTGIVDSVKSADDVMDRHMSVVEDIRAKLEETVKLAEDLENSLD